jgi:hypothetical protein
VVHNSLLNAVLHDKPPLKLDESCPQRVGLKPVGSSKSAQRPGSRQIPSTKFHLGEAWRSSGRAANQISGQPQDRRVLGLNISDKVLAIAD